MRSEISSMNRIFQVPPLSFQANHTSCIARWSSGYRGSWNADCHPPPFQVPDAFPWFARVDIIDTLSELQQACGVNRPIGGNPHVLSTKAALCQAWHPRPPVSASLAGAFSQDDQNIPGKKSVLCALKWRAAQGSSTLPPASRKSSGFIPRFD